MQLVPYRGALTPETFSESSSELTALTGSAGIYDLGYHGLSAGLRGNDRLRWLNGMVTNTVQSLEERHCNYSFLLNAQGRILGDSTIYCFFDLLLQKPIAVRSPGLPPTSTTSSSWTRWSFMS